MIDIIFAHRGTLDKFLGDGLLAIFGAPLDDPEHHTMAARTGIAMVQAMDALSAELKESLGVELRMGVAIHSGHAIVGNIGSEQRMEFTAIGDAVNVAARIEALNKEYHTDLLASRAVVDAVGHGCGAFREVAEVRLRGVQHPIQLYTIETRATIVHDERA
jgi:adenylate cyclase